MSDNAALFVLGVIGLGAVMCGIALVVVSCELVKWARYLQDVRRDVRRARQALARLEALGVDIEDVELEQLERLYADS